MRKKILILITASILMIASGCVSPQVKLFSDAADPLRQFTISGEEPGKVLVIPVTGVISDSNEEEMFRTRPGMVQEIVAQLELAKKDSEIKAILLKVDTPGGSVTASDILYHELLEFKKETEMPIVVSMMNVAASGGYYISLPADHIMAHPTSVTGSVGVIFIRPNFRNLMEKIGVDINADVSGVNKDMGSPFREITRREADIFEELIDTLGRRFIDLTKLHRPVSQNLAEIATGRIFIADQALEIGLIDEIGYLPDAIDRARKFADLPENSKVVVYRRTRYPDDNIYNSVQMRGEATPGTLIDLGLPRNLTHHLNGFYYLWTPGLEKN